MRARGVTYDTGFVVAGVARSTHEPFDHAVVERELRIIKDDLCCNAVRITGSVVDRLVFAAEAAARLGLEVWLAPLTCDLSPDEALDVLGAGGAGGGGL